MDETLFALLEGYGWLPARMRRAAGSGVARTRLAGRRTVALRGPEAARFFYDERHIRRDGALPGLVKSTLTGHGAVHTLDGAAHRARKALFLALLTDDGVARLVDHVTTAWDDAVDSWSPHEPVVLFDETAAVLTRAVCAWSGVPLDEAEVPAVAADLVAMVDGFATPGPRHWRARSARRRREAWLARLIEDVRGGAARAAPGSAVEAVARHQDADGRTIDARVAAVELLNVLRPTVAVCWWLTFAAHALHRRPHHRAPLREEAGYAEMFVQEVRRFYPFAPFVGGLAVRDLDFGGEPIRAGSLVLLDIYGQHHDPLLWKDPYVFEPRRFADGPPGPFDLIPQGGGDPATGHRCPGDDLAVALTRALARRLAGLRYDVPRQNLTISLRRIPARPASGFVLTPAADGDL
ncbi:cytochrome P450 [Sphaerisporangium siamense]|uniref:Fatty-acid peroxygenase n=1 Tax=Sphaerisporangium siamense TaxID=795645 RepID=A0A7W7D537_9ACTN|nr:cytochrome P450 [Sphaerisporangium siamense]MBB4699470.1 fatty-acid peroxygenase [Sphaerisporangium siamense]